MGFWCLSKIIERHVFKPSDRAVRWDFAMMGDPTVTRNRLRPFTAGVFAASQRVDEFERGKIAEVLNALEQVTGANGARLAATWQEWTSEVAARKPSLLVVLPHTLKDPEFMLPALEIAATERLLCSHLDEHYVGSVADAEGALVILLGCETADPSIPFHQFPAAFRESGAAIVLATLTRVLGRHAAPVARRLIEALGRQDAAPRSFGEVMRNLRRNLLAEGLPIGLALVAFGDADWMLTPARS